jgi:hypothetical protein
VSAKNAITRPEPGIFHGRYVSGRYIAGMSGRTRSSTQVMKDQISHAVTASGPATTRPVRK